MGSMLGVWSTSSNVVICCKEKTRKSNKNNKKSTKQTKKENNVCISTTALRSCAGGHRSFASTKINYDVCSICSKSCS